MKKRKIAALLLTMALTATLLAGCGNGADGSGDGAGAGDTGKKTEQGAEELDVMEHIYTWRETSTKRYLTVKEKDQMRGEAEAGSTIYTYNEDGKLIKQESKANPDFADIKSYSEGVREYTYDDQGRNILYLEFDAAGKQTSRRETSYSEDGLTVTENSFGEDGKQSYCYITEYYDIEREKRKSSQTYKYNVEISDRMLTEDVKYDEHENEISEINYYEDGGKNEFIHEYTYDEHGAYTVCDYKSNGELSSHAEYMVVYDEENEKWVSRETLYISYDKNYETGERVEGKRTVSTRDEKGRLLKKRETAGPEQRLTGETVYERNADGKLLSWIAYRDEDHTDISQKYTAEYDAEGTLRKDVEETYYDGKLSSTKTGEYDEHGSQTLDKTVYAEDGHGYWTEYTYGDVFFFYEGKKYYTALTEKYYSNGVLKTDKASTYDENNNETERVYKTLEYDENGQLTREVTERTVKEYQKFEREK